MKAYRASVVANDVRASSAPHDSPKSMALAPGATVALQHNNATEAGKQAVRDATKDCGRNVYF